MTTAKAARERAQLAKALAPDALDSIIYVARQPGGHAAPVPLSALHDFHARRVSGGRNVATYFPELYARVVCTDIEDPLFGHSGAHGPCPHEILVCVAGAERLEVYTAICELAGFSPPTEDDYHREAARVVQAILERLGAAGADAEEAPRLSRPDDSRAVADLDYLEVEREVQAFLPRSAWSEEEWYIDLGTGEVVLRNSDGGIDEREHPHAQGRYEGIEPLRDEEADLLTLGEVRRIVRAVLRSRRLRKAAGE